MYIDRLLTNVGVNSARREMEMEKTVEPPQEMWMAMTVEPQEMEILFAVSVVSVVLVDSVVLIVLVVSVVLVSSQRFRSSSCERRSTIVLAVDCFCTACRLSRCSGCWQCTGSMTL